MATKKALLVGINYPNTDHQLQGCVNDVLAVEKTLIDHFDFRNITLLLDERATTEAILYHLEKLVEDAKTGDVLYFHYSGHGSQVLDQGDADYEPDGLDEIICPIDLDWEEKIIKDDDLKRIFDKVPDGVNLTVVLDCCNSGGGLDQLNQYQHARDEVQIQPKDPGRFLPPPHHQEMLLLERKIGFKKRVLTRDVNKTSLLISGCMSHQTSADAYINGKYMGAATFSLLDTLKRKEYDITYKDLVDSMNKWLTEQHYTQRPELNGTESLFNKKFLSQYITDESEDSEEVDATISTNGQISGDGNGNGLFSGNGMDGSKISKILTVIGFLIFLALWIIISI